MWSNFKGKQNYFTFYWWQYKVFSPTVVENESIMKIRKTLNKRILVFFRIEKTIYYKKTKLEKQREEGRLKENKEGQRERERERERGWERDKEGESERRRMRRQRERERKREREREKDNDREREREWMGERKGEKERER